jgi:predicted TIM-barrel fold metal-dependent hydrolase
VIDHFDIIDGHVHCFQRDRLEKLADDIHYTGAKQFCALVIDRNDGQEQWNNALWLKQQMPEKVFVFGGLDFTRRNFNEQFQELIDVGCDGLKLLIGKPDRRKTLGVPLDSSVFTPMLSLAEETRFPVLWHVGDPPEFWSEKTVPLWARQRGWWYDESHPTKQQIEAEIARVFERHPRLNLILPHLFFLSDRLERAARLLDKYPAYCLDLAPGVEMYHNLTARHDEAREFFIRFADRIIFGTDFGMSCGWGRDRGMMIRRFLETMEVFPVPEDPAMTPDDRPMLRGLGLPHDVLRKIYGGNFRRVVGDRPRALQHSARCASAHHDTSGVLKHTLQARST